ncbi:MAG: putative bifunctional diguanylate cyclase/phosphodiesterase, partial [Acidimicrobiales bacterium]
MARSPSLSSNTALGEPSRPRLTSVGKVWAFTGLLYVAGLVLMVTVGRNLGTLDSPLTIPWFVLALLFYVAERYPVVFHFRRDAQSFSLSEVALVIGLYFSSPAAIVVGLVVGSSISLLVHRRQSRLKFAFNLSHFFFGAVMASVVFNKVVYSDPLGPEGWGGAIFGIVVATLISHAAITTASSLSGGRPEVDKLPRVLLIGITGSVANAALGLMAVTLLWVEPRSIWLMVVPIAVCFVAYNAYVAERNRSETMEFIYESTRMLHRSPEVDSALIGLLDQARKMFRAERAEITLLPVDERDPALRTSLGPGGEIETMVKIELRDDERVWAEGLPRHEAVVYPNRQGTAVLVPSLAERGIRDGMVWVVRSDARVIATVVVANRLGDLNSFDESDLDVFETLANNVGVVLENGRLEQSVSHLRDLEQQMKHQSQRDSLTHLANRRSFLDAVDERLAQPDSPFSVLFVDIDDFKTVNDSLGHAAGDGLLISVAQRLVGVLHHGDLAARLGGDEFAVLVPGSLANAEEVAQRVLECVRAPMVIDGDPIKLAASVGIAPGSTGTQAEEVLRNADVAMYTAKGDGKGRAVVFNTGMQVAVIQRHELLADLQRAIERDEFSVHYQPIVDLPTNDIVAVEALIRWNHPSRGLVSPDEFIPMSEESGLIIPIGKQVLLRACQQLRIWQDRYPVHRAMSVSVNLSARQLHQPGFVGEVIEVLNETGIRPETLMLEITESLLMQDTEVTINKLRELRALGICLAIDDFGTG